MRAISDIFLTINGVHERLQFYSAVGIVRLYCRFAGDRMIEVVKKLYLRIEFILDKILCKFADYIRRVIVTIGTPFTATVGATSGSISKPSCDTLSRFAVRASYSS